MGSLAAVVDDTWLLISPCVELTVATLDVCHDKQRCRAQEPLSSGAVVMTRKHAAYIEPQTVIIVAG